MEVDILPGGPPHVLRITGSLDALTADDFSGFASTQIQDGATKLVADLSQVEFVSSAGLRAILAAVKECRQNGGDFRLAAVQPGIARVLEISGFNSILKSFATVDEALASYDHTENL